MLIVDISNFCVFEVLHELNERQHRFVGVHPRNHGEQGGNVQDSNGAKRQPTKPHA